MLPIFWRANAMYISFFSIRAIFRAIDFVVANCRIRAWGALQVIIERSKFTAISIHLFTLSFHETFFFEWSFFSLTPFVFVIRSLYRIMIENSIQNQFDCSTIWFWESFYFFSILMNSPIKYVNICFQCKCVWFMQTLAHTNTYKNGSIKWNVTIAIAQLNSYSGQKGHFRHHFYTKYLPTQMRLLVNICAANKSEQVFS